MHWSPQQNSAMSAVSAWHQQCAAERRAGKRLSRPIMRVFGFAGTGKTTLARHFAEGIAGDTCYAAFTGKAALMMSRNGCHGASTIHGLIYNVVERDDGSMLVAGWMPADEFADRLGMSLDEDRDFSTVAGLVLDLAGAIPQVGDVVEWHGWRIEVVDLDGRRIDKLLVARRG